MEKELDLNISIAITDNSGNFVSFLRVDNPSLGSIDVAKRSFALWIGCYDWGSWRKRDNRGKSASLAV